MKKLILNIFALSLFLAITSCVNDDDVYGDNTNKETATTSVSSLNLLEGETGVIPFTISRAINKASQFKIEIVSGNAEQNVDFSAGSSDMDADTGIPGQGFEITVPAYATSFDIPVSAVRDLDQTEGTEVVNLKISAAGVRTILTPTDYLVQVIIEDFEYCTWTLEELDDYADGWQGAFITLTTEGASTDYTPVDAGSTYEIHIRKNSNYSFTYTSGTTGTDPNTAGAPGYEEENSYTLTSPDGTVYSDGPVPTVGTIVEGVNTCN